MKAILKQENGSQKQYLVYLGNQKDKNQPDNLFFRVSKPPCSCCVRGQSLEKSPQLKFIWKRKKQCEELTTSHPSQPSSPHPHHLHLFDQCGNPALPKVAILQHFVLLSALNCNCDGDGYHFDDR